MYRITTNTMQTGMNIKENEMLLKFTQGKN